MQRKRIIKKIKPSIQEGRKRGKQMKRKSVTLKRLTKLVAHKERQRTGETHSWGLPIGACPLKRKLRYIDGYRY